MNKSLSEIFMERLEYARKKAGYNTQEALADAYDRKYNSESDKSVLGSVKKWERGAAIPKADSLLNICELLNCSADYLLGKQDAMKNENVDAVKRTGLSEDTIEILHIFNSDAHKYIVKTIDFLLEYENSKHILNEDDKKPLAAIQRFFAHYNNKLQYFSNTGFVTDDELCHIFADDLYYDDAALLHINNILKDMKKEWFFKF